MNRESHLNTREEYLNRKQSEYYKDKEQLITDQIKLSEKQPSEQALNDTIVNMAEKIKELKNENKGLKNELKVLLKRIDDNTQWSWLKDFIIPFISPALAGFLVYQNQKAPDETETNPFFKNLHETFSNLPTKNQNEIRRIMKNKEKMPPAPTPAPQKG
jgi:hypothetical protein